MRIFMALTAASLLTTTAVQAAVTVSFGGKIDTAGKLYPDGSSGPPDGLVTRFVTSGGSPLDRETFYTPGLQPVGTPPCGSDSTLLQLDGNGRSVGDYSQSSDTAFHQRQNPQETPTTAFTDPDSHNCFLSVADTIARSSLDINFVDSSSVTYLGFLWASPDTYNYIQFVNSVGNVITPTLTGGLIYSGTGNNQINASQFAGLASHGNLALDVGNPGNEYLNFQFATTDNVNGIRLGTTNFAFEVDNVVIENGAVKLGAAAAAARSFARALAVPEPGAGVVLLAGLGLLGFARRRRA